MNRKMVAKITLAALAFVALLCAAQPGRAADAIPYPSMAPLDQYLMADREAEIVLARLRRPFPATPQLWSSGGMVMRLPWKARTVLSAL